MTFTMRTPRRAETIPQPMLIDLEDNNDNDNYHNNYHNNNYSDQNIMAILNKPIESNVITGPQGDKGDKGEPGKNGRKSTLLNMDFDVIHTEAMLVATIPYNGERYDLQEIYVVFSEHNGCILDVLDSNGNVLTSVDTFDVSLTEKVFCLDKFDYKPKKLDTVSLYVKCRDEDTSSKISSIEFTM